MLLAVSMARGFEWDVVRLQHEAVTLNSFALKLSTQGLKSATNMITTATGRSPEPDHRTFMSPCTPRQLCRLRRCFVES